MSVVAFKEKSHVLADQHGWSLTIAKGYVDGETFRKQRKEPPIHAIVGIDDYSEAFRAGYFHRQLSDYELSSGPSKQWRERASFSSAPPSLRMISDE